MADELRAVAPTGKTSLSVQIMSGDVLIGAPVALVETAQAGYYTADAPSGLAAGAYVLVLLDGGSARHAVGWQWDGAVEMPTIPGAPADASLCRVYGYLETPDNRLIVSDTITFELMPRTAAIASERLISGRVVKATTDAQGRIVGPSGDPWVDLQRNDMLTPAGTYYAVTCADLGVRAKSVTLAADTADLRALLLA